MRISEKQKRDIECIKHFIPKWVKYPPISDNDILNFLAYSDRGLNKDLIDDRKLDGFNALYQGKRWRGIHINEMWRLGKGEVAYLELFSDMPRVVAEYCKKEFGINSILTHIYEEIQLV